MSMESIRIENMYDLNETIAAEIFEGKTYPWEVLPLIKEFIVKLGNTLDPAEYDKIGEDIWVAKSAKSVYHRKGCRGASVCIYPWQCDRR